MRTAEKNYKKIMHFECGTLFHLNASWMKEKNQWNLQLNVALITALACEIRCNFFPLLVFYLFLARFDSFRLCLLVCCVFRSLPLDNTFLWQAISFNYSIEMVFYLIAIAIDFYLSLYLLTFLRLFPSTLSSSLYLYHLPLLQFHQYNS